MTHWFIYVLRDPRSHDVRYVGYSKQVPTRFIEHLEESKRGDVSYKCNWIRSLFLLDLEPVLSVIHKGCDINWRKAASKSETHFIHVFKLLGEKLTNATEGGDGGPIRSGYKNTEIHNLRVSESNKGRVPPNKGIPMSALHRSSRSHPHKKQRTFKNGSFVASDSHIVNSRLGAMRRIKRETDQLEPELLAALRTLRSKRGWEMRDYASS